MKSAYKWRITNSKYVYITDEYNYGPFIYDKTTQTRVYENMGTVERADDAVIADVVSELTLEEYTERFNQMKILMETDEETSRVKLLDVSYYYDFNNDECVLKAAEPECEGYTPIISISATSLNYDEQPTANVEVFYSDIDKTVRYNVTVGIPKGEKGDQGSAGTGSTIQISMYPNGEGTYDRPVHTQYIEEDATYQGLYDHLHLAPITDGDVIDEKSCIKDGQVVTFVEDSILTIDYKETNAQNINASGDMNIGGNVEVSGTTNIYGQLTVQSGITAEGDISAQKITANTELISNGNLTVQGNSNVGGNSTVSGDLSVVGNTALNGTTNINGDITLSETAKITLGQIAVPVGTIMLWPTNEPPEGWLLCNGETVLSQYETVSAETTTTIKLYPPKIYRSYPTIHPYFHDREIMLDYIYSTKKETTTETKTQHVNVVYHNLYDDTTTKHTLFDATISYKKENDVVTYYINNDEVKFHTSSSNQDWRTIETETYQNYDNIFYPFLCKLTDRNEMYIDLLDVLKTTNCFCRATPTQEGSLQITTPNISTRFVLGGNGENVLGMMGGSENVKLKGKNLPPHTHGMKWASNELGKNNVFTAHESPSSTRAYSNVANSEAGDYWADENTKQPLNAEPFSILPPYMVLNYIIKYK